MHFLYYGLKVLGMRMRVCVCVCRVRDVLEGGELLIKERSEKFGV